MPRRPAGVPLEEGDDYDARALLEANGLETQAPELIELLGSGIAIVQAAAARVLGAEGAREAIGPLERLANDRSVEETARVQAAYALARMGADEGESVLRELIRVDPETTPAPLQAAGALAKLGDASGFEVVRSALESPNRIAATVAAKQLHAFVPFADRGVDVYGAFARALERPEPAIVGEARAQLEAIGSEEAQALLAPRG